MLDEFLHRLEPRIQALVDLVASTQKDTERNKNLRRDIALRFLAQLLTDDERAQLHGLPASCRMRENAKILMPEKLVCGEHVWIGENAYIDATGGLLIGDHTTIGVGVYVWTHTSILANLERANIPGGERVIHRSTQIGSGCYIVGHAVINPGVCIGDGSVILPMSCVTSDVPAGAIYAGSPAHAIGQAGEEFMKRKRDELETQRAQENSSSVVLKPPAAAN